MKRLLTILLVMTLVLTSVSVAFGDTHSITALSQSANLATKINVNEGSDPNVYFIDVEWGDLTFIYTKTGDSWNTSTHNNDTGVAGSWDHTEATITLVNHSNDEISVAAKFSATGTGTVTESEVDLKLSATSVTLADAESVASGLPADRSKENTKTITVSVDPTGADLDTLPSGDLISDTIVISFTAI